MRYVLFFSIALIGCGDDVPTPLPIDMTPTEMFADLSAVVVPSDLLPPLCLQTNPGLYSEYTIFGYRNNPTGSDTPFGISVAAIVKPDGTIVRPMTPITSPMQWRCDSPMMASPINCQAPCCAGDPSIVPLIYFTSNGWALYKPGQCLWADSNHNNWFISVQSVQSQRIN